MRHLRIPRFDEQDAASRRPYLEAPSPYPFPGSPETEPPWADRDEEDEDPCRVIIIDI